MKDGISTISLLVATIALGSSIATFVARKQNESSGSDQSIQIAALQGEVNQQRATINEFVGSLQVLAENGALSGKSNYVDLDLSSPNYGRVDTANGFFLISCRDVQPFLNGQKVTLHIGNPLNVRFMGYKLNARWGTRYPGPMDDLQLYSKWRNGLRSKDYVFTNVLEGGSWNEVEIVLNDTVARQVGCLQIALATDVISLLPTRK